MYVYACLREPGCARFGEAEREDSVIARIAACLDTFLCHQRQKQSSASTWGGTVPSPLYLLLQHNDSLNSACCFIQWLFLT